MNILYLSAKKKYGGIVNWMDLSARELEKRGHKVFIVSHPKSVYSQIPNPELKILKYRLNFMNFIRLFFLIKKNEIDIILGNIEKEIIFGGILARIFGIPFIRRVGNERDFRNRLKSKIVHKLFVDNILFVCRDTLEKSRKICSYIYSTPSKVIYHNLNNKTPNNDTANIKKTMEIPDKEFLIGMVGSLIPNKGFEKAIRIMKYFDKAKLIIVGSGQDRLRLEKIAEEEKVSEKVIFTGYRRDRIDLISIFDIALICSKYETIPNVLYEFFHCKKPIITTNVGGISEIVEDETNAIFFNGSEEDLIQKISYLRNNSDLRATIAMNAYNTLTDKFNSEELVSELVGFYESLRKSN